jgi:hypothetical protein
MTRRTIKFCRNCRTKAITLRQRKCRTCGGGKGRGNVYDVREETVEEAQAREIHTARMDALICELTSNTSN